MRPQDAALKVSSGNAHPSDATPAAFASTPHYAQAHILARYRMRRRYFIIVLIGKIGR